MTNKESGKLARMELEVDDIIAESGMEGAVSYLKNNPEKFIELFLLSKKESKELIDESWWNAITNYAPKTKLQIICEEEIAKYYDLPNGRKDFYTRRAGGQVKPNNLKSTSATVFLLYGVLHRVFMFSIPQLQDTYNCNVKNYRDRWREVYDKVSNTDRDQYGSLTTFEKEIWDALSVILPRIKQRGINEKVWSEIYNNEIFT